MKAIFSLKALALFWTGLLAAVGSGAVALQLTMPPPPLPPPVIAAAAPAMVAPAAPPSPTVAPVPFENHSLLAMLPPPRPVPHPSAPLPVPPVPPPPRHFARVETHRAMPVYAAEPVPAYDPVGWGRADPYAGLYARARPYAYPGPQTYYGW